MPSFSFMFVPLAAHSSQGIIARKRDAPRRKSVPWSRNFQMGMYIAAKYAAAKMVKQYKEYSNCD